MNRIHQKMSLEQKIQTLKEDLLDRDQTTFVKIRSTGRLGWVTSALTSIMFSAAAHGIAWNWMMIY